MTFKAYNQLKVAVEDLQSKRLTWVNSCPCRCKACDDFHNAVQDMEDIVGDSEDRDGPGEEDGPWAKGWEQRCGK